MYTMKKRGPSTDPCGTPDCMTFLCDLLPLSNTNCVLLVKYDSIRFVTSEFGKYIFSLLISVL